MSGPITADVAVVGGGIIGVAAAWRCAQRGLSVVVVDAAPGSGATWTAAGMLAPVTELHYGEQNLFALGLASAARYPALAAELAELTGRDVGLRTTGTVVAAWDGADLAVLRDLAGFARELGHDVGLVSGRELRRLVPQLAPGVPGGLVAAGDHSVDNRRLHAALFDAATRTGVRYVRAAARELQLTGDAVTGVECADGSGVSAATTVLAAGAWSRTIAGLPHAELPPVRPVKGQTLRLRLPQQDQLEHTVRGTVGGSPVYLVPRHDGELVVGASSEEAGFDLRPRAGAVYDLLRDAQTLVPAVAEAELVEVSTGLRPGSPDNAPLIGASGRDGLVIATGHYRNGVLLAPVTADAVAALIADGALPDELAPFTPTRFRTGALV